MINQTISHYRITGRLGSGGMGVVYEAEDLALGRKVALKFLPPHLSRDQNSLDRFLLEARAASALNHPNICTVYAVENAAGDGGDPQSFIAMELLEGQSVDQKLVAGPLPLERLLDIAIQLADAMDAAHAKGIIHRDIKPANIFVTQRGQVKVLDFGLAKLARRELDLETIGGTQDSPLPANLTSPGATVGTIAYMSPEQARGEELDTRSDLFSLGAVIYQMATGKMPFTGATSAVVFHGILEVDPTPAIEINPTLPPKLQEILEKLLEKDRDLRYQSAADLRGDLKRLKRDTESGRKIARASSAGVAAAPSAPAVEPSSIPASPSVAPPGGSKRRWVLMAAVMLMAVLLILDRFHAFQRHNHGMPFGNITITKVTDSGTAVLAAISPDGKYILVMMRENGLASLWLRNVPTNSNAQVEPPADVYYSANGLRFSPDGNYLYFVRSDPGQSGELKYLYRAPLLGGTPQKLASDVDSNVTFSPGGKQLAFLRYDNPEPGKYRLIVRPTQGNEGDERVLASGPNSQGLNSPAWSPDGKAILCVQTHPSDVWHSVVAVDTATGGLKAVFSPNGQFFESPTWMPDGGAVLGLLRGPSSNFRRDQITALSYPDGKLFPITRDTNSYSDLSVAADGRGLTTILSEGRWNLFLLPASDSGAQARSIAPAEAGTNFTWTTDGQLIDDQATLLNRIDPASGRKAVIATEEGVPNGNPAACADGRSIVFDLVLHGGSQSNNVWRMDAAGGNLMQLTNGKDDSHAVCSSDGRWVYYMQQQDESRLARVPIGGGTSQTISNLPIIDSQFDLSPNGKLAAYETLQHTGEHKVKLALVPTDSGEARQVDFERPVSGLVRFSHDGKAVVYPIRENGVDNLWLQPLDGSNGRQITNFTGERIYDFHWSFDGKQLALVRGHTDSDVVLIQDQGK